MKASIVPRRLGRRPVATGVVALVFCALALLAVLRALALAETSAPAETSALPETSAPAETPAPAANDEPVFSRRAHVALWIDEFDDAPAGGSADTPGDRVATDNHFGRYLTLGLPGITHDADGGLDGSGATRLAWTARRSPACRDDSQVLEGWFPATREIFVQFSVRYTPGFVFDWSHHRPCEGNAKKLFLLWSREGSRFVFISENGALGVGSDHDHPLFAQNRAVAMTPASLADGRWHRVTFHIRQGSDSASQDGAIRGWIDGVQRWSYTRVRTHNDGGYYLFKLPATFNQGSPVNQVEWLDGLRIWRPRD